jgi:hypothetical protein
MFVGEILHEAEALRVGPVQVFEGQHQTLFAGQRLQQPKHRLGQHDGGVVSGGRALPELREQPTQDRPERSERGEVDRAGCPEPGEQRLDERSERDGLPVAYGAADQYRCPGSDQRRHLVDQTGLADARLADDGQRCPAPPTGGRYRGSEGAQLDVSPDERRAAHRRHAAIIRGSPSALIGYRCDVGVVAVEVVRIVLGLDPS